MHTDNRNIDKSQDKRDIWSIVQRTIFIYKIESTREKKSNRTNRMNCIHTSTQYATLYMNFRKLWIH